MNPNNPVLQESHVKTDKLTLDILWGLFALSLGLSSMHDTFLRWAVLIRAGERSGRKDQSVKVGFLKFYGQVVI
jgi:hypothetical protein